MELKNLSELKKTALRQMSECWSETAGIVIITAGYYFAFGFMWVITIGVLYGFDFLSGSGNFTKVFYEHSAAVICLTLLFVLVSYIVKIPFDFGVSWFLMQNVRGRAVSAQSFFGCYSNMKRFVRTVRIKFKVLKKKMLFTLVFLIIGAAEHYLAFTVSRNTGNSFWYTLSTVLLILMVCCLAAAYMFFSLRYCLVPYVFALDPDTGADEIIERSIKMMYGREMYMTDVVCSFIKWIVPCIFIFPLFLVLPYLFFIYANAVNEIIYNYSFDSDNESDKKIKDNKIINAVR